MAAPCPHLPTSTRQTLSRPPRGPSSNFRSAKVGCSNVGEGGGGGRGRRGRTGREGEREGKAGEGCGAGDANRVKEPMSSAKTSTSPRRRPTPRTLPSRIQTRSAPHRFRSSRGLSSRWCKSSCARRPRARICTGTRRGPAVGTRRMPPMGAMATVIRMRLAHFSEENILYKIRKITISVSGMTSASRFWERFCDSYSPAHSRR